MPLRTPGLSFGARLRFALADLRVRRRSALPNALAMAFAVFVVLLLGFYGWAFYRHYRAAFDDALPTRVVADSADVHDLDRRFTDDRLAELRDELGAAAALPKVELGVRLSAGAGPRVAVTAEGSAPDDPALAPRRLRCGRAVARAGDEVVLSEALFAKLGGTWGDTGPTPAAVRLEAARTFDGRPETHACELRVVGLLRRDVTDRVFVPLDRVRHLDRWCAGQRDARAGGAAALFAYGPPAQRPRVAAEVAPLKLTAEPAGELVAIRSDGDVWVALPGADRADAARRLRAAGLPGDVWVARAAVLPHDGKPTRLVALAADDPRWQLAPGGSPPRVGAVVATDLPAGGEAYTLPQTLDELAFDPTRCPGLLTPATRVRTDDWAAARRLAADFPGAVTAERPFAWQAVEADPEDTDGPRLLATLAREVAPDGFGPVGLADMAGTTVRVLPDALFRRLVPAETAPSKTARALAVGPAGGRPTGLTHPAVRIVAEAAHPRPELWVSAADAAAVAPGAAIVGAAVWGPWDRLTDLVARAAPAAVAAKIVAIGRPGGFSAVVPEPTDAVRRRLGTAAERCPLEPLALLPVALRVGATEGRGFAVAGPAAAAPTVAVQATRPGPATVDGVAVALVAGPTPAADVFVLDAGTFRRLAAAQARARGLLPTAGTVELAASIAPEAYGLLRAALPGARPLTPVHEERLVRYRLRPTEANGTISAAAATALGLARPTFVATAPAQQEPAACAGRPVPLRATTAADPHRFAAGLRAGRWVGAGPRELVAPAALVEGDPAAAVGRTLVVQVERLPHRTAPEPPLGLPLTVVGVHDGPELFAPAGLVGDLGAWRRGEVVYHDGRRAFEAPADLYRRTGHVRATFHAADATGVAGLVRALEERGYRCESRLAELDGLRHLARVVFGIVALLGGGFALVAALAVGNTTAMAIRARRFEIGVLKAFGVGGADVVRIYALQGLVLGTAAFAAGLALSAAVEPAASRLAARAFRTPPDALPGWLPVAAPPWLFAAALAVAVGVAVIGAAIPAALASRLRPVDALRRTD